MTRPFCFLWARHGPRSNVIALRSDRRTFPCQAKISAMRFPRGAVDKIRERVERGLLPSAPATKMFGGYGTGQPCSGCDVLIDASQVEYEFEDRGGRTIRFDP